MFSSLLMANHRKIHSYILSLVPNFSDAEEILQETVCIMWRKFDQFELGSNFDSWGVKIAYYNILSYRKKHRREACFSDAIFREIADVSQEKYRTADRRLEAMRACIKKLDAEDQGLLKARYEWNNSVESIALRMNRSSKFVYKRLSQIIRGLYGSILRTMQDDDV